MATKRTQQRSSNASSNNSADGGVTVTLPLVHSGITLPSAPKLAYYAGLGAMAAFEFIDWPVALVIAAGHELASRTRHPAVQEAAEGVESGA